MNPDEVMGRVQENKSMLNPTDLSMMKQDGEITPDMSVRDYLGKFGIDVDGPISQLSEVYKQQKQKASMQGKMGAIAGGQPQNRFPQGAKPMAQAAMPQNLDGLLSKL